MILHSKMILLLFAPLLILSQVGFVFTIWALQPFNHIAYNIFFTSIAIAVLVVYMLPLILSIISKEIKE